MSGSAVPVASAGSKKAGVSETCTPQVIVPSAAEAAGAAVARAATQSARAVASGRIISGASGRLCGAASRRVGVDTVFLELLPERVAVDAEQLGGPDLVALGLAHDGAKERLFDEPDHEAVKVCRGVAPQTPHAVGHLPLDDVFE